MKYYGLILISLWVLLFFSLVSWLPNVYILETNRYIFEINIYILGLLVFYIISWLGGLKVFNNNKTSINLFLLRKFNKYFFYILDLYILDLDNKELSILVAKKFGKFEKKLTPIPDPLPTVIDYEKCADAVIGEEFLGENVDFDEVNESDIKVEAPYTKAYYLIITLGLVNAPAFLCLISLFVDIIINETLFWINIFAPLIIIPGILKYLHYTLQDIIMDTFLILDKYLLIQKHEWEEGFKIITAFEFAKEFYLHKRGPSRADWYTVDWKPGGEEYFAEIEISAINFLKLYTGLYYVTNKFEQLNHSRTLVKETFNFIKIKFNG